MDFWCESRIGGKIEWCFFWVASSIVGVGFAGFGELGREDEDGGLDVLGRGEVAEDAK